ncbi:MULTISPECIES: histidine phosphatase family protein [Henriciella]|jgi:broad specificity phosphatase PhoE|uniref:Histidine phosphatase family protein n=1 Tax=Henriciella pelagia TaxID=1977912 RepID=A0ABQ1J4N8_9PROT|nr:histidine phosphatase family protein [Henriciella pelagia]GGB58627.1 hypothetical protein GCM10011503_03780 [Henriciella pelagia]
MIWLIRHGEAAAGWGDADDPGLSGLGRKQAFHAADILRSAPVTRAISSPMKRCQQTADAFTSRSGMSFDTVNAVTEIPTPAGLDDRRAWLSGFMSGDWSAAPALLKDWRDGLIAAVEGLPDNTAVFTHFVAINAIVGHLNNVPGVTVFRPANCSITTLTRSGSALSVDKLGSEAATRIL